MPLVADQMLHRLQEWGSRPVLLELVADPQIPEHAKDLIPGEHG